MKKILCFIITLVCILTTFSGCDSLNRQPATLADSISIPENGVIEASVFEALKNENKAVTFKGQHGNIRYEWIVFGSDITEAKDLNFGIDIMEADSEKLSFCFLSEESFGFSPALSIYLNDLWDAQSAILCASTSYEAEKQEVSITGKKQSILNFSPKVQTGTFIITPNKDQDTSSSTVTASDTDAVSSEDKETSKIPEPSQNTASPDTQSHFPESQKPSVPESLTESQRTISDGSVTGQDQYKTDPVPEGKPLPAEPDTEDVNDEVTYTCTFSIECLTILNNIENLEPDKLDVLPSDGIIFKAQTVVFYEGESVYDVLLRVCRENNIHMEASWTPMYNSAYVEGIGNLYEFDCGSGSGWMYRVDGWYPNYGCSRYQLCDGEVVEWRYTCDLGSDIGGGYAIGG